MESPCSLPENQSSDRSKAIEELVRGRQYTLELRSLLKNDDDGVFVVNQDLVLKILGSFTNTLSILKNGAAAAAGGGGGGEYDQLSSDEVSQIQTNAAANKLRGNTHGLIKSEDSSGDSSKSTSVVRDRRGCYKRRKCSDSWIKDSPSLVDDGHAWRKYGQKVILNAKYPRNYFRCTHKNDQGCLATKQVQRIQEDPPLFRTTYSGQHTCKDFLKPLHLHHHHHQLFIDSKDQNNFISFSDKGNNSNHSIFSSLTTSIKQEYKHDHHDTPTHKYYDQSESSDHYIMSHDHHHHHHQLTTTSSFSCTDMDDVVNFDADAFLQHFEFNA